MKKASLTILVILMIFLLFLASCSPENQTPTPDIENPPNDKELPEEKNYVDGTYTLMIYMCGSNLESRAGLATKNITEMLSAEIPENTKVIIQTGGATAWRKYDISPVYSSRYEILNGNLSLIEQNINANMGDYSTLSDFLVWGEENYPAEHRSIIFWDHGGGSMNGVCFDENFHNDSLSLLEIRAALAMVNQTINNRFYEFIGFDACLMATYDTANILRNHANYMIASEELEPGSGWDYKVLLENLGKEDFYTKVLNAYAKKQETKTTYTLSAIKLSEFHKVDEVIYGLVEQINYNLSYVGHALSEGKEFGTKGLGGGNTNLFDLGLLAKAIGIPYDFSDFIINVNGSAHETATGLSLYFPTTQKEKLKEYAKICPNLIYSDFLEDYFNNEPETTIFFTDAGFTDDNIHLSFTLSNISKKYVKTVGYELHSYAGSSETGKLYVVGTDNDVSFSNGVYTVDFEGRWVFLNDMLLHCDVHEEKPTHTTFSAPVMINGEMSFLLFAYFKETKKIIVEGYITADDTTSRINELSTGTEVTIVYEDPVPEGENPYYEEGTIVWGEDSIIAVKYLEAERYQYIPYVIDIYGNIFYGDTASLYFDGTTCTIEAIAAG
ncbi:MAG: clostripain-related cysteine peptidase [Christensenellales bacterium]|nr:hypothetical protein [Clostridiales bacterium]